MATGFPPRRWPGGDRRADIFSMYESSAHRSFGGGRGDGLARSAIAFDNDRWRGLRQAECGILHIIAWRDRFELA
jgi:hypothetical protein